MHFPDATHHLDLCRKLRRQLQRIESQPQDTKLTVPINIKTRTPLPLSLPSLIEQLEEYIEWGENNEATIEAAVVKQHRTVKGSANAARPTSSTPFGRQL